MANLFFSYSHRDQDLRDELEIHLSALKRQGLISTWSDRRIVAGSEVDAEIDRNLEQADIILLLVSAYFIDSEYCYGVEMKRALEKHSDGSARVIPVILRPCDWKSQPFGKLLAATRDGKPVTKYPDIHEAFTEVGMAVRKAVEGLGRKSGSPEAKRYSPTAPKPPLTTQIPRSSNLRVKREFTERERDVFHEEAIEFFSKFFEGSLKQTFMDPSPDFLELDFLPPSLPPNIHNSIHDNPLSPVTGSTPDSR